MAEEHPSRFPDTFKERPNSTAAVQLYVANDTFWPGQVQNTPEMLAVASIQFLHHILGCSPATTVVQQDRNNLCVIHPQPPFQGDSTSLKPEPAEGVVRSVRQADPTLDVSCRAEQ